MTIKCLSSAVYEVVSKYLLNVIFHFLWLNLSQKRKRTQKKILAWMYQPKCSLVSNIIKKKKVQIAQDINSYFSLPWSNEAASQIPRGQIT